jgi:hypothetical protein
MIGRRISNVMDEVLIVGICQLLRTIVFDLGQDKRGQTRGPRRRRGRMFSEDSRMICYTGAFILSVRR